MPYSKLGPVQFNYRIFMKISYAICWPECVKICRNRQKLTTTPFSTITVLSVVPATSSAPTVAPAVKTRSARQEAAPTKICRINAKVDAQLILEPVSSAAQMLNAKKIASMRTIIAPSDAPAIFSVQMDASTARTKSAAVMAAAEDQGG